MSDVCTLPEKQYDDCRNCTIEDNVGWRCTDGRCIELKKKGNGMLDCYDNSDETARKWLLMNKLIIFFPVSFKKVDMFLT